MTVDARVERCLTFLQDFADGVKAFYYPHYEEGFFLSDRPGAAGVAYPQLAELLHRAFGPFEFKREVQLADLYFPVGEAEPDVDSVRIRASLGGMEREYRPDTVFVILSLRRQPEDPDGFERLVVTEVPGQDPRNLPAAAITRYLVSRFGAGPAFQLTKARTKLFVSKQVVEGKLIGGDALSACIDHVERITTEGTDAVGLDVTEILPSRLVFELERTESTDLARYDGLRCGLLEAFAEVAELIPKHERKVRLILDYLQPGGARGGAAALSRRRP